MANPPIPRYISLMSRSVAICRDCVPCISQLLEHVPDVSSILTICERVALHMERG